MNKRCNDCLNEFNSIFDKCPICGSTDISYIDFKEKNEEALEKNPKKSKANLIGSLVCLILDLPAIIYGIVKFASNSGDKAKLLFLIIFSIVGIIGAISIYFLDRLLKLEATARPKKDGRISIYRIVTGTLATYFIALLPQILYFLF